MTENSRRKFPTIASTDQAGIHPTVPQIPSSSEPKLRSTTMFCASIPCRTQKGPRLAPLPASPLPILPLDRSVVAPTSRPYSRRHPAFPSVVRGRRKYKPEGSGPSEVRPPDTLFQSVATRIAHAQYMKRRLIIALEKDPSQTEQRPIKSWLSRQSQASP